ncbi:hypothetical protein GCM10028819_40380 [Spirosoma humi]
MMRFLCLLALSVGLLAGAGQATAQAIVIKGSSDGRIAFSGKWLFRAGDSTGWASPVYNDRHWTAIAPNIDLDENPQLWQARQGWFRQKFRFRRLPGEDLMLTFQQFGHSEIFLDGRRQAVLKPVRYDSGGSQRIVAFLPIRIKDTNQHTLAVRYAFRADPLVGAVVDKAPFLVDIDPADRAGIHLLDGQQTGAGLSGLMVGIFGLLSLLHFLFYRANPTQTVHRALSATMLAFALSFLTDLADHYVGTLTLDSLRGALAILSINAAFALLLLSVYTYLGRRPGRLFWGLVVVQMVTAFYTVSVAPPSDKLFLIPFVGILIEYIRVSWLAKRHNPDVDARLPWNSLKVTLYAVLAMIPVAILMGILESKYRMSAAEDWVMLPLVILVLLALFSIPLGLSFSLVRDYARTYRTLQNKLQEVEQLSAQAMIQEQEKQQLLARQNEILELQVADRTAKLSRSLRDLQNTQQQLIQKEKMASLGELTAGIAHEIQNPLNFVNNFSEVSDELVDELRAEQQNSVRDTDLETELLDDLKQNLQKITQHGKRASAIVKGMLEHSRSSLGERQSITINALANEYLQIAYQGLRAKDKEFTVELTTDYGADLSSLEGIPQEIGRVLLNLFNNAFYAVRQKQKTTSLAYQPRVTVQTRQADGRTLIRVSDNGTGMPESVQEKIFQPFFTTKPTGEGTGLGLSLSYDIITKGHGGSLLVESQEGEGSTFIVELPNPRVNA